MDKLKRTGQRPFTVVYNDFLDSENLLDPYEKLVMIHLMRYGEQAFPSLNTLARKTGISRRKVQYTIDALVEKGFLAKENRKQPKGNYTSNLYTIIDRPDVWQARTLEEATAAASRCQLDVYADILRRSGYTVEKEKPVSDRSEQSETGISNSATASAKASNEIIHVANYTPNDEEKQGAEQEKPGKRRVSEATPATERYSMEFIQGRYEYDVLLERFPVYSSLVENTFQLLYDTLNTGRATVRIGGEDKPAEVVRSKLLKLNSIDLEYAINLFQEQTGRITHPLPWLLTVLYRAKEQGDFDITNQVQHDLYGSGY